MELHTPHQYTGGPMGVWSGGGYHAREEFDLWWFVGIVFIKLHDEFKCPIFKRSISRSNNNRIPTQIQSTLLQKRTVDSKTPRGIAATVRTKGNVRPRKVA